MARLLLTNLAPGTTYKIQLRSVEGDSFSEWSREFSLPVSLDNVAPDAPAWAASNEWVVAADNFIATWQPLNFTLAQNKDFNRYELELGDGTTTKIISTTNTSYTLTFETNKSFFGTAKPTVTARVRSVDGSGNASGWTALKSATNPAPTAPANFTATPAVDMIQLSWDATTDDDLAYYAVYVGTPGPSTMIFKGLANRFTYRTTTYSAQTYTLRAFDKFGQQSTPDRTATAQPDSPFGGGDTTPPNAPTAFVATVVDDPQGMLLTQTAKATWTAPTPTDITLAGYHIRYKIQGTTDWNYTEAPKDPQQPFVIDRYLKPNVAYDFEIRSFDAAGLHSAWVADSENAITPAVTPSLTNALIVAAGGYVRSSDYTGAVGSTLGWKIDDDGIDLRNGVIRGNTLAGGQIISTAFATKWDTTTGAYVTDVTKPAWNIDLEGDAELNNVLVRGNLVVGDVTETPTYIDNGDGTFTQSPDGARSSVASANYVPGSLGWIVRSDGYAEFRNLISNSIDGEAVKANSVDVSVLKNSTLGQDRRIRVDGEIYAENTTNTDPGYGSVVSFSGDGFFVRGPEAQGKPDYILFPTSGAPNIISGTTQASTLSVSGLTDPVTGELKGASFRGVSHYELGSELILDNAIGKPLASPSVVEDVPSYTLSNQPAPNTMYGFTDDGNFHYRIEQQVIVDSIINKVHKYSNSNGNWQAAYGIPVPAPVGGGSAIDAEAIDITTIYRTGPIQYMYILWYMPNATTNKYYLARYTNLTSATWTLSASATMASFGGMKSFVIGNDNNGASTVSNSTRVLVATWDSTLTTGANVNPIVRRFDPLTLASLSGTVADTTVADSPTQATATLGGVAAGTFDYGTQTLLIGYNVGYGTSYTDSYIRAYDPTTGARQSSKEWNHENFTKGIKGIEFIGTGTAGGFYVINKDQTVYNYTLARLPTTPYLGFAYSWFQSNGRTVSISTTSGNVTVAANTGAGSFSSSDVGAEVSGSNFQANTKIVSVAANGSTADLNLAPTSTTNPVTMTVSYETGLSPINYWSAKARRRWTMTGAAGPVGTVLRFYAGAHSDNTAWPSYTATSNEMRYQSQAAGGIINYATKNPDFTTTKVAQITGTFSAGLPAKVYSQQTDTTVVTGVSTFLNSPAIQLVAGNEKFYENYVGASVTGTNIPAGTKIKAYISPGSITLDKNATGNTTTGTLNIIRPLIELQGGGYARISQLYGQQAILTSLQDVNTSASNAPPLRVGDINDVHMRADGNEIQTMKYDTVTGTLVPGIITINQGGGSIKLGQGSQSFKSVDMGFRNLTANASGVDTVPHGLGVTPDFVLVTPFTSGAFRHVQVQAKTATNFTVVVQDAAGAGVANSTLQIGWIAFAL